MSMLATFVQVDAGHSPAGLGSGEDALDPAFTRPHVGRRPREFSSFAPEPDRTEPQPNNELLNAPGASVLKSIERSLRARPSTPSGKHGVLWLDKNWHGLHYIRCGEIEPGDALLSQAVLEAAKRSAMTSAAMVRPAQNAAARFNPRRMAELQIYYYCVINL